MCAHTCLQAYTFGTKQWLLDIKIKSENKKETTKKPLPGYVFRGL